MRGVLAIDIGGTKLAAGWVDGQGRVHRRARRLTPRVRPSRADQATPDVAEGRPVGWDHPSTTARGRRRVEAGTDDGAEAGADSGADDHGDADDNGRAAEALLATVVALAREAAGSSRVAVCGVGCGGPMTRGGELVSPLNIPQWRDFPLARRLQDTLGVPVFVDNDAKALALGQGWRGAARGVDDYLAMVVSTGVGGGLVIDGRLIDGASGNAGHIGHVVAVPGGRRCGCGARGCLEAEASGTAVAAVTGRPAAEAPLGVRQRTGRLVGEVVASVANLLDLRLALVDGSVARGFGTPFLTAAQQALDERCRIAHARGAQIAPAGLGDDAALVGAAALGWRGLGVDVGVR